MSLDTEKPMTSVGQLRKWQGAIRVCHLSHVKSAARSQRLSKLLGIPAILLSTIVGTTIFSTMQSSPDVWQQVLVGILSMFAAGLGSIQTFLDFPELTEKHRRAAHQYGSLRREIEEELSSENGGIVLSKGFMQSIRERWDSIDLESPTLNQSIYQRAANKVWKKKRNS